MVVYERHRLYKPPGLAASLHYLSLSEGPFGKLEAGKGASPNDFFSQNNVIVTFRGEGG